MSRIYWPRSTWPKTLKNPSPRSTSTHANACAAAGAQNLSPHLREPPSPGLLPNWDCALLPPPPTYSGKLWLTPVCQGKSGSDKGEQAAWKAGDRMAALESDATAWQTVSRAFGGVGVYKQVPHTRRCVQLPMNTGGLTGRGHCNPMAKMVKLVGVSLGVEVQCGGVAAAS